MNKSPPNIYILYIDNEPFTLTFTPSISIAKNHVFGLWKKARVTGINMHRHKEIMQTLHGKSQRGQRACYLLLCVGTHDVSIPACYIDQHYQNMRMCEL